MNIRDLISYPPRYGIDLDSDEVEAKLAALNIDPDNCTIAEAITALREMPPALPRRAGAPRGNQNRKLPVTRENVLLIRLTDAEQNTLTAAANGTPISTWVRTAALEKATQL